MLKFHLGYHLWKCETSLHTHPLSYPLNSFSSPMSILLSDLSSFSLALSTTNHIEENSVALRIAQNEILNVSIFFFWYEILTSICQLDDDHRNDSKIYFDEKWRIIIIFFSKLFNIKSWSMIIHWWWWWWWWWWNLLKQDPYWLRHRCFPFNSMLIIIFEDLLWVFTPH